jgi:hypothetical protein
MKIIRANQEEKKVIHSKYGNLRLRNIFVMGVPISILLVALITLTVVSVKSIPVTETSPILLRVLKSEELKSQRKDPVIELQEELIEHRLEIKRLYEDNVEGRNNNVSRGTNSGRLPVYDYTKLTAKKDIVYLMEKCAYKLGFRSIDEIYPIIGYESHFNPKLETKTKREHSIGLLMVNTWTNYPKGQDIKKLTDAEFNLNYQLPELYTWYKDALGKGKTGYEVVRHMIVYGQRPDYGNAKVRNYIVAESTKFYKEILAAKIR